MDRRSAFVLVFVFGGLFVALFGFLFLAYVALKPEEGDGFRLGKAVGVVELKGIIMDSEKIVKALKKFGEDDDIKAVVLRVDSPGGAVGPSQEIHSAVQRLIKKKHVVASFGSVAASGGYYAACGAEKIISNPGTLTGSIGVIMSFPTVTGVMDFARVKMNVIKSGKLKDSGSMFRDVTPDDRAYLDGIIQSTYHQFVEAVAEGRKLKVSEVEPVADGRALTGVQAKDAKLVDELGDLQDAIRIAGNLGGLGDDPKVVYPPERRKGLGLNDMFRGSMQALVQALVEPGQPAISGPAYLAPFAAPSVR
jgi:protease IV